MCAGRDIKVQEVLGNDASIPNYYALVIGIDSYQFWPDLRQAREDAENVGKILASSYGFKEVRSLFDTQATLDNMLKELRTYARKLGPNDSLLLYYAGHGYYDKLLKRGYWVPTDAKETEDDEPAVGDWLPNTSLKEYLEVMNARHILVVSDSCFSGSMMRGGRVDLTAKENSWYKRAIGQPSRWCVASGDLETVPDQSVFARKFLQTLQYPRQVVFSASDIANWIKGDVAELSGTQPVFGPMKTASGSEAGEFVFLQEGGLSPARAAAPPPVKTVVFSKPPAGTLTVASPVDGFVSINGGAKYAIARNTPLKWQDIPIGTYTVSVTSGRKSWQDRVLVRDGEILSVVAKGLEEAPARIVAPAPVVPAAPPVTAIQFFTTPSDATVYVDGAPVKNRKVEVSPGTRHAIRVEASGYEPYVGESTVRAGTIEPVRVRLPKTKTGGKKETTTAPMW